MKTLGPILLSIFLFSSAVSMSQNIRLDSSFGIGGKVITTLPTPDMILDIQEQSDGKIIALGEHHLVRYNTDGSLDSSFGTNGIVDSLGIEAKSLLIHHNDDIYIGGWKGPGSYCNGNAGLVHYSNNGTRDTNFGQNGMQSFYSSKRFISAMDLQADGKIIAGITNISCGLYPSRYSRLYRINPNGTLDSTFNLFSGMPLFNFAEYIGRIQIKPNNQILAVGYGQPNWSNNNNLTNLNIALVNSDGSLDSTYGTNGIASNSWGSYWLYSTSLHSASAITFTGKVYLENYIFNLNNGQYEKKYNAFDNQGIIDTNFRTTLSDSNVNNSFNAIAAYSNDQIISARGSQGSAVLQMLDKNANIDSSCFLPVSLDFGPNVLLIDGNGDILVAGQKDTVFAIKVKQTCPNLNDFVTTWKTDNPGLSNDSTVTIYTDPNYTYNYDVDWDNDGVFDTTGLSTSYTIQYPKAGTYTIRIKGNFPSLRFFNSADRFKLISVDQWGNQNWMSLDSTFFDCRNLVSVGTDAPILDSIESTRWMFHSTYKFNSPINHWDVSNVTDMSSMFYAATSFNQDLQDWDVSNVTNMNRLFDQARSFDQSLGNWNISSITSMDSMLNSTAMSVSNYDSTLIGWQATNHLDSVKLGADQLMYCHGKTARDSLIADGWIITGDSLDPACILTNIKEANNQINKGVELLIYPNPSNGNVFIELGEMNPTTTVLIYNQTGQLVKEERIQEGKNPIDLSHLPKGIYLLRLGGYSEKIILTN